MVLSAGDEIKKKLLTNDEIRKRKKRKIVYKRVVEPIRDRPPCRDTYL